VDSARASLFSAESAYCLIPPADAPAFCSSSFAPISSGDLSLLNAALGGSDATMASAAISANNLYLSAQNAADSADAAVTAAEDALDSAQARLDLVEEGPTNEEMDAAEAGVISAQAALDTAALKLVDTQNGASADELANSLATRNSARVAVEAAEERFAEAQRGPESNAISQAQQAVRSAALAVEAAQIRLRNAQIIAPFDGTIASVNISPGEFASAAGTTAPIVMLTPDALILTLDIEETDYPNVKIDQGGVALFDGIPGAVYPFRISEIGLSPSTTSGVITYEAKAVLTVLPNSPRPAPGMNANGQLTTASKADIVVIPPRALRRRGSEQIVDVKRDGIIVETVVTTGVSDNNNVEILTGLAEGDVIVLPVVAGGAAGGPGGGPTAVPTIAGGIR
jgi:RND family efflux transporter MFP subunit